MDINLVNRLSDLATYGYYDPTKNMVVAHFFNDESDKPDVIAFLRPSMNWEVREIVSEKSKLYDDKEVIEITHNKIGVYEKGSNFDTFLRSALYKMLPEENREKVEQENKMFQILKNGYDN